MTSADDSVLWSDDMKALSAAEAIWGKVEHARPAELWLAVMIGVIASLAAFGALAFAVTQWRANQNLATKLDRVDSLVVVQANQLNDQQGLIESMQGNADDQTLLMDTVIQNQKGLLKLYKKATKTTPVTRSSGTSVGRTLAAFGG